MLKNLIVRLLLYPFSVFLIYWGFEMVDHYDLWKNSFISGKQLFSGCALIVIGIVFIVTDVIIIIRDFKKWH